MQRIKCLWNLGRTGGARVGDLQQPRLESTPPEGLGSQEVLTQLSLPRLQVRLGDHMAVTWMTNRNSKEGGLLFTPLF